MANLSGFNAHEVDPTADFDPIPAGKYVAVITKTEVKPNKAGTGSYLQFIFQIFEGEYSGRLLWARLNLDNPNETAVKIARGELSAICRAVGVMQPKDSVELHNLPLVISVKCKKRPDTDEIQNEIKGYEKKEALQGKPMQAANGVRTSGCTARSRKPRRMRATRSRLSCIDRTANPGSPSFNSMIYRVLRCNCI